MNVLPPQLFLDYDELYLRVRFDNGDGQGLRHLEPLSTNHRYSACPGCRGRENCKLGESRWYHHTTQLNEQILKYLKPQITLAPQAPGLVFNGQKVTLHSRAEGKYLTYQWYRMVSQLRVQIKRSMKFPMLMVASTMEIITVVVSNDFGSVTTQPTSLQVDGTPPVTPWPRSVWK